MDNRPEPTTLKELKSKIESGSYLGDWTETPTFGGPQPRGFIREPDTISWDRDFILTGICPDELKLISRAEWARLAW